MVKLSQSEAGLSHLKQTRTAFKPDPCEFQGVQDLPMTVLVCIGKGQLLPKDRVPGPRATYGPQPFISPGTTPQG